MRKSITTVFHTGEMLVPLQGLPEGYFHQNKEYHRVSEELGPAQSPEEIDRLLKDAGLSLACSSTN